jgi:predicted nucleic acid-binding protein
MAATGPAKRRIFVDVDVLFAGVASPSEHSASLLVLRMAEITLVEALVSEQVIAEVERNLAEKLPQALPVFRLIASRCLRIVPDPSAADLEPYRGLADPADLPILFAALREGCSWLVTFNVRHYQPGHPDVAVLRPGDFLLRVRDRLARLTSTG